MKKTKGDHDSGHLDETWLIPYADLLTLLLALFIVLFAMSTVDKDKFQSMAAAFYTELSGTPPAGVGGGGGGGAGEYLPDEWILKSPRPGDDEEGNTMNAEQQMAELYQSIAGYIDNNGLASEINLNLHGEILLMTLTSDVWFPSGSADISQDQRLIASKLVDLIAVNQRADLPLNIIITGHTDNVPINNARFKSNWYLSACRAINFMEAMLDTHKLDPRSFSARGYGEFEPIDTNDTEEGRRRNRRVEVLISYNSEMKEMINISD